MAAINIEELRQRARRRLPKAVFDFMDGGAMDERTRNANLDDFAAIGFAPRYLVDVASRTAATTVLGTALKAPIVIAPTGLTGLFWPKGEMHAYGAARARGLGYCLSTNASTSIEELATLGPGFWLQVYVQKDRGATREMLERAEAAGATAAVITVDLPTHGIRERDYRNGFKVPPRLGPSNLIDYASRPGWLYRLVTGPAITFANIRSTAAGSGLVPLSQYVNAQFDPSVTWKDIAWVRSIFKGKLAIKGILSAEDGRLAVEHGLDGVIVSNHGGRQLDGGPSAIRALGPVAEAVGGRIDVLMDSGVRRGGDVVKALALGAKACLVGRAFLYGLAAGGPEGVARALDILLAELDNTMALVGARDVGAVNRGLVRLPAGFP